MADIALYYHPEAYSTSLGSRLMGRNAAGESFLRGFFAHHCTDTFWALVQSPEQSQLFTRMLRAAGRAEPVTTLTNQSLGALSKPGAVYIPGPGLGDLAWKRAAFGHTAWSLCGITHTTASARVMDAIAELLTAPVQPWDALICTSAAVKDNVCRIVQAQADHLARRLGADRFVLPQLPVIPLGIHTADFDFTADQRSAARAAVGATDQTLVVLFSGRLSFHAKAHPLAMYQALEQAAPGHDVLLVECGWHANEYIATAYAQAAACACPSVRVVTLDGRKPESRQTAWACADVFCSLSDNIQETFGLVPVEAMAAGLPAVVSDWDGYKDTVRDGVDGMRIPTIMPGNGLGGDLALRHALDLDTYDMYCGNTCSLIAVDLEATAQAFTRLFATPDLRRKMGEAGRQRARTVYDWAIIIPQYEALWARQTEIRRAAALPPVPHPWPARLDPFYAFAAYPTRQLTPDTRLELVDVDVRTAGDRLAQYRKLKMVDFAKEAILNQDEGAAILEKLKDGSQSAGVLVRDLPLARQPFIFRGLVWLLKLGILKLA